MTWHHCDKISRDMIDGYQQIPLNTKCQYWDWGFVDLLCELWNDYDGIKAISTRVPNSKVHHKLFSWLLLMPYAI